MQKKTQNLQNERRRSRSWAHIVLGCCLLFAPAVYVTAAPMVFLDTTDNGNGIDGFSAHGSVGGIDTSDFHPLESVIGVFRENDCDPVTAIKLGDAASVELAAAAANGQMFSRFNVYFFAIDPITGATELSHIWGLQNPVISKVRVTTEGEGPAAAVVDTLTIVPQVISVINDGSVVLAMVECSKKDK